MSESPKHPLPKRRPRASLEILRDQPPFVTPWPIAPGVSGWFQPQEDQQWPPNDEDTTELKKEGDTTRRYR